MILPSTTRRVPAHTPHAYNQRIDQHTRERIAWYADHPERIDDRLRELDREWDIERALEANAASLALGGVILGALVDRRLLVLPLLVTAFLLQHALQGWCPPVPLFRRKGVRTQAEIQAERYALLALRGDLARRQHHGATAETPVRHALRVAGLA